MSTKNQKPATTSDILSGDSVTNPPIHKSNNPFPLRARCGKVARLPKEIRDQINEMLLDGIPHSQIILKLRQNFGDSTANRHVSSDSNVVPLSSATPEPASLSPSDGERAGVRGSSSASDSDPEPRNTEHLPSPSGHTSRITSHDSQNQSPVTNHQSQLASLTPHHLTTWKKYGGYRDWLRDQQRLQECKLRHELTLDLARSSEGLASYQAAPKVAVAQICQTIIDLGPEGLKDAMKDSPLNCFRLLNALSRLINSGLKCEHHIQKASTETDNQNRNGITRADLQQIERDLNLL